MLGRAELRVGKRQSRERRVARGAVRGLLHGPGEEAFALQLEEGAQVLGAAAFDQHGLVLRPDVVVDERDVQLREPALGA